MAIVKPKTNPECYANQGILANSTTTNDAVDFGFNAVYLQLLNLSSDPVYARFGSTAATTDDFPISTGESLVLQNGPLIRDFAVARNSTSTELSGVSVLALGA